MKLVCLARMGTLSCALAATAASAQVHQVAFEWGFTDPRGFAAVDTCVAVSPDRVVVATNQRLQLFSRSGGAPLDERDVLDTPTSVSPSFPFQPGGGGLLFDPRVEYDAVNDRLWILYPENDFDAPRLHIAVSKEGVTPEDFSSTYWHFWTGPNTAPSPAFDLKHASIDPDLQFEGIPDHPTVNVDEHYLHIAARDYLGAPPTVLADAIINFPLTHSGGSMLNGARPSEGDLDIIQLQELDPPDRDDGLLRYAVQEPFDQFEDGQFYITTQHPPQPAYGDPNDPPLGTYSGVQDHVRLAATYRDTSDVLTPIFRDMEMPTSADWHFNANWRDLLLSPVPSYLPLTPKSGWEILTTSSKFDSGVLAKDVNGQLRIFAAHHVIVATNDPLEPVDHTEFRWYVIDPDLANFPGANWDPQIEVVGTAPAGSVTGAQTYQGAIAVNVYGQAYITFTRSGTVSTSGWPSLVRARLTSDYTTVLYELPSSGVEGPKAWYANASGAPYPMLGLDYADLQADPVHCGFWAVGTTVAPLPSEPDPPIAHDDRAIWLTEIQVNCNMAEMNGDGAVDAADLALFLDYYAKEDPRADMDRSGTITTADYQRYTGEYAKR